MPKGESLAKGDLCKNPERAGDGETKIEIRTIQESMADHVCPNGSSRHRLGGFIEHRLHRRRYRQHPIATIAGTLLPSVSAGVIAYFIAPKIFPWIFPNFRLHVPAALRDRDKLLALIGITAVASYVILIVAVLPQFGPRIVGEIKPSTSNERNPVDEIFAKYDREHKPDPFADLIDNYDKTHPQEPAKAGPRMECFKKAQGNYNSMLAMLNADPVAAASDGGKSLIARRRLLEAYCTAIADCQFARSNALNYTQAFSYCISSAEKDMLRSRSAIRPVPPAGKLQSLAGGVAGPIGPKGIANIEADAEGD